jgi:hypothetical protein
MNAIAIPQPWASLVVHGYKTVFATMFNTRHRGPLAVLAGARDVPIAVYQERSIWTDLSQLHPDYALPEFRKKGGLTWLPRGVIVGIVELVEVVPREEADEEMTKQQHLHGDIGPGRYLWVVENPRPLADPPRVRHKTKLFRVTIGDTTTVAPRHAGGARAPKSGSGSGTEAGTSARPAE